MAVIIPQEFKDMLWVDYPIPESLSVWGGDGMSTAPVADLDTLIASCVRELRSDVYITDYVTAGAMVTQLPQDAFAVVGGRMSYPFQGNRTVKVSFDASTKQALTRYYPCVITYRRFFNIEYLKTVQGDQLRYTKMYMLWKMADKELTILRSVNFNADNGDVNLEALASFASARKAEFEEMKNDIFIYTVGN